MILSDSVRNSIKIYLYNFLKSIPYIWTHKNICFTTYEKIGSTSRTARKFLKNVVGQKKYCRLVTRVLERKNAKRPLTDVPQAYVCIHPASVRVNIFYFLFLIYTFSTLWNSKIHKSALRSLFLLSCARAPSSGQETNFFEITRSELTWAQILVKFRGHFLNTFW